MKPKKPDQQDDPKTDIRENKRRLSRWTNESDPQMHKINMINAKAHGRWKSQKGR